MTLLKNVIHLYDSYRVYVFWGNDIKNSFEIPAAKEYKFMYCEVVGFSLEPQLKTNICTTNIYLNVDDVLEVIFNE